MHATTFLKAKQAHGSSATLHPTPCNDTLCHAKHNRLRFFRGFTSKGIFTDTFFCVLSPCKRIYQTKFEFLPSSAIVFLNSFKFFADMWFP